MNAPKPVAMLKQETANDVVCELNSKVDDVAALLQGIDEILQQLTWRHHPSDESWQRATERRIDQVHCLVTIAKERIQTATDLGGTADGLTLSR